MNRRRLLALSTCVTVVALVTVVSIGSAAGATTGSPLAQQDIDTDDVLLSITVEDDGDARWTVEYRTRLETDDDDAAFEELRSAVEADPDPYAERFRERMAGTAASAENATGREMTITDMSVSADKRELPREYGVLRYEFRWSNFAATADDRLLVGDAIDGLFLDEETALLISWSEGGELRSASPSPSETRAAAVVYEGPREFAGGEPRIELAPAGATAPTGTGPSLPVSPPVAVALVVLALVIAAGAVVAYRRRSGELTWGSTDAGSDEAVAVDEGAAANEGAAAGEDAGAADGAVAAGADSSEPTDPELLSNEERVLRLIEREGGRMKQQAVAERLEWTDAKTSQVTTKLREEGSLEGFRLGRENVLSLPEDGSGTDGDSGPDGDSRSE